MDFADGVSASDATEDLNMQNNPSTDNDIRSSHDSLEKDNTQNAKEEKPESETKTIKKAHIISVTMLLSCSGFIFFDLLTFYFDFPQFESILFGLCACVCFVLFLDSGARMWVLNPYDLFIRVYYLYQFLGLVLGFSVLILGLSMYSKDKHSPEGSFLTVSGMGFVPVFFWMNTEALRRRTWDNFLSQILRR